MRVGAHSPQAAFFVAGKLQLVAVVSIAGGQGAVGFAFVHGSAQVQDGGGNVGGGTVYYHVQL